MGTNTDERALVRVEDLARYLSMGRSKTYELLQPHGPLPVVRIGRSVRVPMAAVHRWIAEQIGEAPCPEPTDAPAD